MNSFFQDLRFGLRMLAKRPGFTLVAVVTLALGIGANTAIFSVVNAVLLRPLAYQNADELMMFYFTGRQGGEAWFSTPAAFVSLRSQNTVLKDVAAWGNNPWAANLTGEGEPERLQGFKVSGNFFQTLGATAAEGRTFLEEEDRPGNRVVVISHDLWQRKFGGDKSVIGRSILLNGEPYKVCGVMPADFRFVLKTDVWIPLAFTPAELSKSADAYLHLVFRLKRGVSTDQARAEMESLLLPYVNYTTAELSGNVKQLQKVLFSDESQMLLILLAAVAFVLLIACVNVANLLLARASSRRRELAIRAALGAGRLRIARQLMVESGMLALAGGACGLLLASWSIGFLVGGLPGSVAAKNSRVAMLGIDSWALGYTFALAIVTTLLFGLAPAIQLSRVNLNESLKESGRSETQGRNCFRSLLVVAEVALAMVLMVGAGLMIKSFWRLINSPRGFEQSGVLTAKVDPFGQYYDGFDQVVSFYSQLLERISSIPGVQYAGIVNSQDGGWKVEIEGRPPQEQSVVASRHHASADYFLAMGIPLRMGRFFNDRDVKGAPPVAIIDETIARRFFPDESPLGKHLRFPDAVREIVGVAGATKAWRTYSFGKDEVFPRVYLPYQQENWWSMALVVRAQRGDPTTLVPAIRREVAAINKDQPIHSFKLLEASVAELNVDRRFSASLMTAFALLAVLLASVGIYGVMSYAVNERTREIGIRMALGANHSVVLRMIIRQGVAPALAGIAIGLAVSLALTRLIESLLFGVSATDAATFVIIAALLALVALAACYVPARRALKVDPVVALRYE
ncbi:MAG: ABC transporter permease [Acidobacteriota bacterium]